MTLYSFINRFTSNHPLVIYALVWTVLLTITVAISSLSPEIAFMSAISPTSSFSTQEHNQAPCKIEEGYIRVPLDNPGEVLCFPAHLFVKSRMDYFVPPIFAAAVVAGSAFFVKAMGLWED
ncbi:hypothetical protein MKW94_007097 [Papaver nudicaule]|uniref:Uncharacterized protein n=1 Tax=Papaver nudicaule TaxID=74823 RepID=A0AA41RY65_PAPNU|nr:hypothetical protein [Papaver nudicaule]